MKNFNELIPNNNMKIKNNQQNNKIEMPYINTNMNNTKRNFRLETIPRENNNLKNFNNKNFDNIKNQILKPTKENEVVKEYLNLIRCTYPYCNCGKCILRKNREHSSSPNYNYDKNIRSIYRNEYHWKSPVKIDHLKNAQISRIDKGFKEHLKSGLISVTKNDYKNIASTEPNLNTEPIPKSKKNMENDVRMDIPFLGRSSYETLYPNWQTFIDKKNRINSEIKASIPFNGKSSYKETFGKIEKKYYIEKASPILKKDNLEVGVSELITQTTSGEFYKPIDLKKSKDLNNIKTTYSVFPGFMVSAPYSKDSFMSTYERAFMNNNFKYLGYQGLNTQN